MKATPATMLKTTSRLTLRPLAEHDYLNWQQAYANLGPAKNPWDEAAWDDSELTKAKFKALLKTQHQDVKHDKNYHFGIFRKEDGLLIGQVSLMDISRGIFQNAYLGYRIFHHYWDQGYATEACLGTLDLAFKKLKLHRIEAGITPDNKASLKVAKKLGLRKEGLSLKRLKVHNKWNDILLFALTVEDLKTKKKS